MIFLDTNVLIAAFDRTSVFHSWASAILRSALAGEGAAINPVVLAELCVGDRCPETVAERLEKLGVVLLDLPAITSRRCAEAYSEYLDNRRQQAAPRAANVPLPDFFIGAHASLLDLPLATADEFRYRTYYPEIQIITPAIGRAGVEGRP